jgi:hypothetical protein
VSKKMVQKLLGTLSGAGFVLLLASSTAQAFGLGIALDGFLTTLETSITGLGLLVGLIGCVGMTVAKMENAYSQFFSGYLNLFTAAGILGGGATIFGTLGLVSGAVLVL